MNPGMRGVGDLDGSLHELPPTIIVELTNVCDLECPFCTTFQAMRRPKGFMAFDLYRQLVDELASWERPPRVSMNMSGEPLLHRKVDRFVGYATKKGLHTFISTNVTRLNAGLAERLVRAGLSSIYLCVDGATKRAHEAYRVGSCFEQVRANCAGLLEARRRLGASNPFTAIQTLLTGYSEDEMDAVIDWAAAIDADEVFFKSLSLGSNTTPEQRARNLDLVPKRPEFRRQTTAVVRPTCGYPLEHTIVYWNGDVGVCCVDFNNMAGLSGFQDRGLRQTLTAVEVLAARRQGVQKQHALCGHCVSSNAEYRGFRVNLDQVRADRVAAAPSLG